MSQVQSSSEQLIDRLHSVSFCQFLRCLQIDHRMQIGTKRLLEEQPVKLVCELDQNFPANELAGWDTESDDPRPRLQTTFFGLYGSNGALPSHYTHLIAERVRQKDFSLREFLDIFNHRLLSLFYRAWEKNCFPVAFETARQCESEDTMTKALWALIGTRQEASRERLSFDDDTLLHYAGAIASSRRPSAESLRVCLADFTGCSVEIETLVGQWLVLDPKDQSRIECPPTGQSSGNMLGVDTIVGSMIWDVENRFRVIIGPVDWKTFLRYMPMQIGLRMVTDFARRFVGPQYDFDVQILLHRNEVRGVVLDDESEYCLGWNTWLGTWESEDHAGDGVFEIADVETVAV